MKTAFPYRYILELPTFEYYFFGGAKYQGGDEAEAEEPLTDKPPLKKSQKSSWGG